MTTRCPIKARHYIMYSVYKRWRAGSFQRNGGSHDGRMVLQSMVTVTRLHSRLWTRPKLPPEPETKTERWLMSMIDRHA
jgi:hypothetical protein